MNDYMLYIQMIIIPISQGQEKSEESSGYLSGYIHKCVYQFFHITTAHDERKIVSLIMSLHYFMVGISLL